MIAVTDIFEWVFWSMIFIANVVLVGVYCGLEMGFYRVNKMRLELNAESNRSARILRSFAHDSDNLLIVLLIGTNIHHYIAAFAVSTLFLLGGFAGATEYYTMLVATPVMFVFGDSVPKNLVARMSEKVVYRAGWFLRAADIAFKIIGISYLVRGISAVFLKLLGRKTAAAGLTGHEGLIEILSEARASGTITSLQQQMAGRAMRIDTMKLTDVYKPIHKISTAPRHISRREFIKSLHQHDFSRIPLLDTNNQITGIVDIHRVLTDEKQLPPDVHAAAPLVLGADLKITDAIFAMQQGRSSMSVVEDVDSKHMGIVTVKDLVEKIVGS